MKLSKALRPVGSYIRPHRRTVGAVIREMAKLNPEVIILCGRPGKCCEVTLPILFDIWAEAGVRCICTHVVTVPRPGWVILVPRKYQTLSPQIPQDGTRLKAGERQ
jgi:hypothetical protein